jgi:ribonuclease T1
MSPARVSTTARRVIGLGIAIVVAVLGWWLYDPNTNSPSYGRLGPPYTPTVTTTVTVDGASTTATADPESGLPVVAVADLPPEVQQTLDLISSDGPFPFDQDGATFQNREGLLPAHETGYYHEYTVVTPGSEDRGARRIITGSSGEFYYTDDHYESFAMISP